VDAVGAAVAERAGAPRSFVVIPSAGARRLS
jgi:galactokinase